MAAVLALHRRRLSTPEFGTSRFYFIPDRTTDVQSDHVLFFYSPNVLQMEIGQLTCSQILARRPPQLRAWTVTFRNQFEQEGNFLDDPSVQLLLDGSGSLDDEERGVLPLFEDLFLRDDCTGSGATLGAPPIPRSSTRQRFRPEFGIGEISPWDFTFFYGTKGPDGKLYRFREDPTEDEIVNEMEAQ